MLGYRHDGSGGGEGGAGRVALRMVDMPARSSEEGRRRRLDGWCVSGAIGEG